MIYRTVPDGPRCIEILINTISIRFNSSSVIRLTWAIALALALPPLLGWNHYAPESNGIRYLTTIGIIVILFKHISHEIMEFS